MKLEEFIKLFADQFDDTDESEFTAQTKFHELDEWSSLTGMGVIALAKIQFGKSITGKEIRECETVEDVYNLIMSK